MIHTVRVPEANGEAGQAKACPTKTSPIGFLADLDIQALDLLVQRAERNTQAFGGFGLAPVALFEPLQDNAPFVVVDNLEKRSVSGQRRAVATLHPDTVGGQQRLR